VELNGELLSIPNLWQQQVIDGDYGYLEGVSDKSVSLHSLNSKLYTHIIEQHLLSRFEERWTIPSL
jgi:hypothetical protein